ncbi:MAG: DUF4340 domain-containing protein [Planctomycetota bacterium]
MNGRGIVLLIFIGVGLGAAWWVTREPDYTEVTGPPAAFERLGELDPTKVAQIRIAKGEGAVELVRDGDGWRVPALWSYPAAPEAVQRLLDAITSIGDPEVRAESASSHVGFELDAAQAIRVELNGEGPGLPLKLWVGKSSAAGQAMPTRGFVRLDGSDVVYEVRPNLQFSGGLYPGREEADSWVDKTVFRKAQEADVERLEMNFDGQTVVVEAKPPEITGPGAAPDPAVERQYQVTMPLTFDPDDAALRGLLNRMTTVYATELVDPSKIEEYGLDPAERVVRATYSDGIELEVSFGAEVPSEEEATDTRYYGRIQGDPRIFTINAYTRNGMFQTVEELTPVPEEASEDPEPPAQDDAAASTEPPSPTTRPNAGASNEGG